MGSSLDDGMVMFVLVVVVISLLLLIHIYTVCFLEMAPQSSHLPTSDTLVVTTAADGPSADVAVVGDDAFAVASLLGDYCGPEGNEELPADCVVCLSALEADGGVRVLPGCRHAFHSGCIGRWLVSFSARCPICRTPVRPHTAGPSPAVVSPPAATAAGVRTDEEEGRGDETVGGRLATGVVILVEREVSEGLHLPLLLLS